MPATKTAKTLLTSQSLAAASSVNTSEWNMTAAYGGRAVVRITNGASPPTTVPVVKFYVGDASGKKYLIASFGGDMVANSITDLSIEYCFADMFCNITIVNGATNGVTVEAYGQEVTGM